MKRRVLCHLWFALGWLVSVGVAPARAQQVAPPFIWAKAGVGPGYTAGYRIAVDGACNVYVAGEFEKEITLGGVTLTSRGDGDAYLAKFTAQGELVWLRQAGGPGVDILVDMVVDAAGNAAITGLFSGPLGVPNPRSLPTMNIGSFLLTSGNPVGEMFVAKYDPQGNVLWARQSVGTQPRSVGRALAFDATGNLYLAGYASDHAYFEQVTITTGGLYLAKYTAQGQLLWARTGFGPGLRTEQLAVDVAGHVYLVGYITGTLTLGSVTLNAPPPNGVRGYLAQLDAEGAAQWVQPFTSEEECTGLAVDPKGGVLLTTIFDGTVTHGGQTFTSLGDTDVLTLKYTAQGDFAWGAQLGGSKPSSNPGGVSGWDQIEGLAVDAAGNSYVGVSLTGMQTLTTPSGTDDTFCYVVSYTPAGIQRWNQSTPPYIHALAVSGVDEVYITGEFYFNHDFGDTHLASTGVGDNGTATTNTFIAKLGRGPGCGAAVPSPVPRSMPNIITPNGDGLNDAFRLPSLPPGRWQLRVFSRWGTLVYETTDYRQDWTAPGLLNGTYYYLLQSPTAPAVKGWLEIVR